jgi:hypothetical protein
MARRKDDVAAARDVEYGPGFKRSMKTTAQPRKSKADTAREKAIREGQEMRKRAQKNGGYLK